MLPPDFVVVVLVQAQQMAAELGLHAHSLIVLSFVRHAILCCLGIRKLVGNDSLEQSH